MESENEEGKAVTDAEAKADLLLRKLNPKLKVLKGTPQAQLRGFKAAEARWAKERLRNPKTDEELANGLAKAERHLRRALRDISLHGRRPYKEVVAELLPDIIKDLYEG